MAPRTIHPKSSALSHSRRREREMLLPVSSKESAKESAIGE